MSKFLKKKVTVVGLGFVGLPMALSIAGTRKKKSLYNNDKIII